MRGLKDKVAVVAGGGQGIERALTLRLAEEGCKVAIFDLKLEVAKETRKLAGGATVRSYELDVGDYAAVSAAVAKVESELGPIWALVNNAGWDRPAPFLSTDQALWDRIIRINLYGPLNTHHVVAPLMVARKGGRIINIASGAARVGTSNEAVYSACKGGLISFTKSVARELATKGVLLNAVCPGPTLKWKDAMVRSIPLKRTGEPEDYAGIVAFLASDDASFITGQTISVAGGMNMICDSRRRQDDPAYDLRPRIRRHPLRAARQSRRLDHHQPAEALQRLPRLDDGGADQGLPDGRL